MKLLAALLGCLVGSAAWAQADWRLSDALGGDRGPTSQGKKTGWVLRVEPRSGGEERTLFQDGVEQSDRLIDRDSTGRVARIRDLRGGVPVWDVTYDPEAGLPREETSFEDGRPSEISTLEFRERVLFRRTVKDAEGNLLFTDTLGRWPDGSLRRLERDGPDGPVAESAWSYAPGGGLAGSWTVDGDTKAQGQHRETIYAKGRTEETLASATQTLMTRVTEELEAGTSRETRTEPAIQRVEKRFLDSQGRLVQDEVSVKDVVTQTRNWVYDAKGRTVEASTESAGPKEVWTYLYQDKTTVATLTRGGTVVREEVSQDGEKATVRLYDRGVLFLVETWTAGKRTKETYYQKGVVVRERAP